MGEDGAVEWLGAIGLFAASVLFFAAFLRTRSGPAGLVKTASLLVLAVAFFFGAGEEISWGQRFFGIDPPEALSEVNTQQELNLHNLDSLGFYRLFKLFWIGFGVVVPIACALSARLRSRLSRLIPILPVWFAALFVIQELIADFVGGILSANPDLYHGFRPALFNRSEITETVLSLLFAIAAFVVFRSTSDERSQMPIRPASAHRVT